MLRYTVAFLLSVFAWIGIASSPSLAVEASTNSSSTQLALQATEETNEPEAADASDSEKPANDDENSAEKSDEQPADKVENKDQPSPESKAEEKADSAASKDDAKTDTPKAESKEADSKTSPAKAAEKPETPKRKTLKIEPKRLKIDLTLDGTFAARKMEEVVFRPEAWTNYEIVEVIKHGEKVRKGETLFKFDSEKLDEAIADLELEQRINELAILKAEEDMPRMERTLKLDSAAAERANQQAREDFDRYREIDRPMMEKTAEFMVKYYNFNLNYEQDELEQLEKMYKDDDLTDETEEIVLKRQRNAVEFAEFNLENAKLNRDETLKVSLPRYDIRIKESLERAELAQARARQALQLDLNRARYELEQRKKARTKSLDRHAKLLQDKQLMEIKSPADGIVFYGQNVNGRWSDTATLINKYKPKNTVSGGTVLMTIVETRPLYVISSIDEGKRPDVSTDQKAKIVLPAEDADRIAAQVKSISSIPVSPAKFEVLLDAEQDEIPDWIVPGMNCKVQLTTYNEKKAIVVPKTAVHDDEDDDDKKFVWLVDAEDQDAKPKRREVKLGKRKGTDVQIVKGLKEGDIISLEDESKKDESKKDDSEKKDS